VLLQWVRGVFFLVACLLSSAPYECISLHGANNDRQGRSIATTHTVIDKNGDRRPRVLWRVTVGYNFFQRWVRAVVNAVKMATTTGASVNKTGAATTTGECRIVVAIVGRYGDNNGCDALVVKAVETETTTGASVVKSVNDGCVPNCCRYCCFQYTTSLKANWREACC
jgi:hypothetical protein